MRYRLAVRFAIEGDLRFISHHDSLRLFERALARADIPVRFSEGFNPRPQMRLALPRPVGAASRDELLVMELTRDMQPEDARTALQGQMPAGISLLSAENLADDDHRRPCEATYELPVGQEQTTALARRISEFMASPTVIVMRQTPRTTRTKSVDIRSFVKTMDVSDGRLTWTQLISQEGTARLAEVLDAIELRGADHLHRVCRTAVAYQR